MRAVDRDRSKEYLAKAEQSLLIAKMALERGAYDNAVMSSVHAAINALDALTVSYLGRRASGAHSDVLGMIKGIFSGREYLDISRQFSSLMSLKNTSEYQPDPVKPSDARLSVTSCERIVEKVKTKLSRK